LDKEQQASVQNLIAEYADIFTLSISEVTAVEGAVHKLQIDKNAKFSTKVHQKPTTPPQKKYLHESIDAMLAAGIIEQCNPSKVNTGTSTSNDTKPDEPKLRICQNFSQINKVTQIAPMPQGDIRAKQQRLSEEKYKPFLLEFTALKFSLNKFSDTIWGFPVIVETDCQALRDDLSNNKPSATHARWRDGILNHQFIDVKHIPGKFNVVADRLSRANEGQPREEGDGSEWTVSEDWEVTVGLVHDIFEVADIPITPDIQELREQFKDIPMLLQVIDTILELDHGTSIQQHNRAQHRASEYMIDGGRLWRVAAGHQIHARLWVECVSKAEAVSMAREEHKNNGHWQRDAIQKALLDHIWTPGLDSAIIEGIKDCGHCKNFGGTHLHALLDPITRWHPFELNLNLYKLETADGTPINSDFSARRLRQFMLREGTKLVEEQKVVDERCMKEEEERERVELTEIAKEREVMAVEEDAGS
ncbi:hypothetical protein H0H81_002201, partial [Sphagnurus paluster]